MSLILDLIVIVVALVCIISGAKRGFVKSVFSLASSILALLAAWLLTPYVSTWLYEKCFSGMVAGWVQKAIMPLLIPKDGGFDLAKLFSDMPEAFSSLLKGFEADATALAGQYSIPAASEETIHALSEKIASPAATLLSKIVAFAAVFLVAILALWLVSLLLGMIVKLPVLRTVNRVLGLILGILTAMVWAFCLCKIMPYAVKALAGVKPEWFGGDVIDKTLIVRFLSGLNVFSFISGLFPS